MNASIDDYRWLLDTAAEPWIEQATQAGDLRGGELVRLVQLLRKSLSAERAHLVVELAELRRRGREKFALAERMFFTRVGLEQATDEQLAAYKAARMAPFVSVADLCCGVGGDLLALGRAGAAIGVDASPSVALIAERNARIAGLAQITVRCSRAEDFPVNEVEAWHIDPDRRPEGKRTTRLERHEPPLETLDRLLDANRNAAIKLAPAAEVPEHWLTDVECQWLGSRGECRQLVAWHGELAREPGKRVATVLAADGTTANLVGDASDDPLQASHRIGRYLYEPAAAVLAAKLGPALTRSHAMTAVSPGVAYLTADRQIADPLVDGFEVLETMPLDVRKLAAWLKERGIGKVEVKKRGVEVDPLALQRKLSGPGGESAVLLLLPLAGRVTAAIARRLAT